MFASRLRTRVFSVLFSFVNYILSGSCSRHRVIFSKLLSQPACSSQVDLHWASPHLPWGMQCISGPFILEFILEILSFGVFFAARFTLRQLKTPVWNATNLRTFCFEDYHYAFQETLCLVTLAHWIFLFYSSLYFYTFLYIPPHSCPFHTFYLTQIFYLYYHAEHFSYRWWRCCSRFNYFL